ncbi:MAG: hypothetical protein WCO56_25710, partial [Verrucomicrobiota bacterium]
LAPAGLSKIEGCTRKMGSQAWQKNYNKEMTSPINRISLFEPMNLQGGHGENTAYYQLTDRYFCRLQ